MQFKFAQSAREMWDCAVNYFTFNDNINNKLLSCRPPAPLPQINQVMNRGCDERCTCAEGGQWLCLPRCSGLFIKRGKAIAGPNCYEKPAKDDDCCSVMVCTDNSHPDQVASMEKMIERGEFLIKFDCT